LHDLQHDRQILLAAVNDLLSLSETMEHRTDLLLVRRAIVIEASRIANRLLEVQKKIEELDLD
jgi:hypothetical protein